jgi:hypothetical protein
MSNTETQFKTLRLKRDEVKALREEINILQLSALQAIALDYGLTDAVVEKYDPESENALHDTLIINDDITARFDRFGTLTIYSKEAATKNSNYRGKVIAKVSLDNPEKVSEVLESLKQS